MKTVQAPSTAQPAADSSSQVVMLPVVHASEWGLHVGNASHHVGNASHHSAHRIRAGSDAIRAGNASYDPVPRVVWAFWFGKPMAGKRSQALQVSLDTHWYPHVHAACLQCRTLDPPWQELRERLKVPFVLVTNENLAKYTLANRPLHQSFGKLTPVHKVDYLWAYFAHYHGGGFHDVKVPSGSWSGCAVAARTHAHAHAVAHILSRTIRLASDVHLVHTQIRTRAHAHHTARTCARTHAHTQTCRSSRTICLHLHGSYFDAFEAAPDAWIYGVNEPVSGGVACRESAAIVDPACLRLRQVRHRGPLNRILALTLTRTLPYFLMA